MQITGIVAEYNPFHTGHMYQIQKTKEIAHPDLLIAVMSGNFVQRGEPAIIDKWERAKCAIENGVDLVIELPYIYATQSCNQFAHGALTLLKLAGINALSFGSECGNLDNLLEISETPINPDHLRQSLDSGMSFPKSYSLLTTEMRPNDILAVAYLKEIQGTNIEPILIERTTNYLDEEIHEHISSATAIRKALKENRSLNHTTPMEEVIKDKGMSFLEAYYPYIRTYLLTSDKKRLADTFLFSEGIENHIVEQAKKNPTYDGFLRDCTNWRYTSSRIRRTVLQAANQITKEDVRKLPPLDTLRILAFNDKGRAYLHDMRKKDIHIASRFATVPSPYREMEYKTTLFYSSIFDEEKRQDLLSKEIGGALYVK